MTQLSRRRFLAISAAATALAGPGRAGDLYRWQGSALGARASITLDHPDAARIASRARAEIERLEGVFSLYRPDSALARLNRDGHLAGPPFELLECLGLCGAVHDATAGAFDPTVQPLWQLYAQRLERGEAPAPDEVAGMLGRIGWHHVAYDAGAVRLTRPGMALTLNGIAQGYIADRVAAMLRREGLRDVLVDTGELRALGGRPGGGAWPVSLQAGTERIPGAVALRDMALASSAPLGTVLDAQGKVGHVIDPSTGRTAPARWTLVSVTAPSAAVADALSTAGCLMARDAFASAVGGFRGAAIAYLG
ncbi:MAG: FAD:protein FMN transferase [Rhodobacteraceae bacterium]|nr:FAD:protein FMN transferase [Paracoccaceae bacterium]